VGRLAENLCSRPDFGDTAGVEHRDAVGDLRGDAEVVGDEYDAASDVVAQSHKQSQHLRLHGDIERRCRFVGDDQLGVAGNRDRDHHPLSQPAGQLVRVGAEPALGLGDADRSQ
jgi:hypothetical protein